MVFKWGESYKNEGILKTKDHKKMKNKEIV